MNKIRFTLTTLLLLLLSPIVLWAQNNTGTIKGSMIDSATNQAIDFMTVALKKDNQVIKTALTENNGTFTLDKITAGNYTLTAVAIGYTQTTKNIVLKAGAVLDLGKILMHSQSNKLNEVAITAAKPLIKQEADRISYDIQADPESKSLTALDMMRKVPLLSVDGDDKLKLKGSGGFKILINGKPSAMMANSPEDALKSMPASTIQKIEVITTPPAKYDSEGLSGLINIITTKNIDNGYNGNVNIREQFPSGGPGIGANFTLKQGKFGISSYGGTGFYFNPTTPNYTFRQSTGPGAATLTSDATRRNENNFRYIGAELSYEIDTLNLITAEINPYSGYNKVWNYRPFRLVPENGPLQSYDLDSRNKYEWGGANIALNYQLGFKGNKEHLLTFSYRFDRNTNPQENNILVQNPINYTLPSYIQNNRSLYQEQTVQADYTHPLKNVTIEAGLKGILRDNSSNFEYQSFDAVQNGYVVDPTRSNEYKNNQYVLSAYNSYLYKTESWSFKGGVRLEETIMKADFTTNNTKLDKSYLNLIPTLSINKKFKNNSNLNLGYTQRIERPSIYNLNPFVDRSNPNFINYGNPDLKPVLSNNIELNYSTFKKGSINIGINYRFSNNTIQNVQTFDPVTQATTATYFNIGKDRQLGANFNINYPITEKLNFSANGNILQLWIEGSIDGKLSKNDGITGDFYINTGYKFEKTWRVNGYFGYGGPQILLQGKNNAFIFSGFTGSKDLIKDKLTISGTLRNPFSKFRVYRSETSGQNFTQVYRGFNYNRGYNISLSWKFGKLEGGIKKNQRGIKNDDVKSGSGSSN